MRFFRRPIQRARFRATVQRLANGSSLDSMTLFTNARDMKNNMETRAAGNVLRVARGLSMGATVVLYSLGCSDISVDGGGCVDGQKRCLNGVAQTCVAGQWDIGVNCFADGRRCVVEDGCVLTADSTAQDALSDVLEGSSDVDDVGGDSTSPMVDSEVWGDGSSGDILSDSSEVSEGADADSGGVAGEDACSCAGQECGYNSCGQLCGECSTTACEAQQCVDGTCVVTSSLDCDDGNACTDDQCNPQSGCSHDYISNCCGNGVVEPGEECDFGLGAEFCTSDCTTSVGLLASNVADGQFLLSCGKQCHLLRTVSEANSCVGEDDGVLVEARRLRPTGGPANGMRLFGLPKFPEAVAELGAGLILLHETTTEGLVASYVSESDASAVATLVPAGSFAKFALLGHGHGRIVAAWVECPLVGGATGCSVRTRAFAEDGQPAAAVQTVLTSLENSLGLVMLSSESGTPRLVIGGTYLDGTERVVVQKLGEFGEKLSEPITVLAEKDVLVSQALRVSETEYMLLGTAQSGALSDGSSDAAVAVTLGMNDQTLYGPFQLNSTTEGSQRNPVGWVVRPGRVGVVWGESSAQRLLAREVAPTGVLLTDETVLAEEYGPFDVGMPSTGLGWLLWRVALDTGDLAARGLSLSSSCASSSECVSSELLPDGACATPVAEPAGMVCGDGPVCSSSSACDAHGVCSVVSSSSGGYCLASAGAVSPGICDDGSCTGTFVCE